jgi:glycosyltransferase involved in cell wall biosynthesis
VDVVQAPTLLFPRRRQPLVVTIHDTVPWTHPETLTPRGVHWHKAMAQRAAVEADAISVPTHAVAAQLAESLPGLAPSRIHVLGAGVARGLLAEPDPALVERVAKRLPERYLFSLATLEPRKGLDVLVAALDRLGAAAPPLVVVGQPGWGGVEVDRPGVHVLGRIPDAELGVVLRRATALVMPSRAEGFGLPVVEAMAVGTPVICSDAPALVEVAGDAAVVVPRGDVEALAEAIAALVDDVSARAKLGAAGRARSGRFDWDEVARRAWSLYRTIS